MLYTKDLIQRHSEKHQLPYTESHRQVKSVLELIARLEPKEKLVLKGFGTFKRHTTPARMARNPRTGEPVEVPEKETLRFKASDSLFDC